MAFWACLLRCGDGSYYAGHTDDLDKRIGEHVAGVSCGYTATRLPVDWFGVSNAPHVSRRWHSSGGSRVGAVPRKRHWYAGIGRRFRGCHETAL